MGDIKARALREAKERKGAERCGKVLHHELGEELHVNLLTLRRLTFIDREYEVMMVICVRNRESGADLVAFHTADTMDRCLTAFQAKFKAKRIKWRIDEPPVKK